MSERSERAVDVNAREMAAEFLRMYTGIVGWTVADDEAFAAWLEGA